MFKFTLSFGILSGLRLAYERILATNILMTKNMHLAELNGGSLVAPTDDPRVAGFMNKLDRMNGRGQRLPGSVWMM
jgi:hypothetical protein